MLSSGPCGLRPVGVGVSTAVGLLASVSISGLIGAALLIHSADALNRRAASSTLIHRDSGRVMCSARGGVVKRFGPTRLCASPCVLYSSQRYSWPSMYWTTLRV